MNVNSMLFLCSHQELETFQHLLSSSVQLSWGTQCPPLPSCSLLQRADLWGPLAKPPLPYALWLYSACGKSNQDMGCREQNKSDVSISLTPSVWLEGRADHLWLVHSWRIVQLYSAQPAGVPLWFSYFLRMTSGIVSMKLSMHNRNLHVLFPAGILVYTAWVVLYAIWILVRKQSLNLYFSSGFISVWTDHFTFLSFFF